MAERRSVAADVVGSKPTSRPNHLPHCSTSDWGLCVERSLQIILLRCVHRTCAAASIKGGSRLPFACFSRSGEKSNLAPVRGNLRLGLPDLEAWLLSRRCLRQEIPSVSMPPGSPRLRSTTPLLGAYAGSTAGLAGRDSSGLSFLLQSAAAHHPLQSPARLRNAPGPVLRIALLRRLTQASLGLSSSSFRPTSRPTCRDCASFLPHPRSTSSRCARCCLRVPPRVWFSEEVGNCCASTMPRSASPRLTTSAHLRCTRLSTIPASACAATAAINPGDLSRLPLASSCSRETATSTSTSNMRTNPPGR